MTDKKKTNDAFERHMRNTNAQERCKYSRTASKRVYLSK